jgi:pilus assembly protein Flp/PilA
MFRTFIAMVHNDEGQGLVEYSLIIALVSIVAIAALTVLGAKASNTLSSAASNLS